MRALDGRLTENKDGTEEQPEDVHVVRQGGDIAQGCLLSQRA